MYSPAAGAIWWHGRSIAWPAHSCLLDALWRAGVLLPGACQGHGRCGQCRVRLQPWLAGAPAMAVSGVEIGLLGASAVAAGERLACQQATPRFVQAVAACGAPS